MVGIFLQPEPNACALSKSVNWLTFSLESITELILNFRFRHLPSILGHSRVPRHSRSLVELLSTIALVYASMPMTLVISVSQGTPFEFMHLNSTTRQRKPTFIKNIGYDRG